MTALVLALASMPASAKTITAVMHSDLRVIDPGFTTSYITRDHGYMVYLRHAFWPKTSNWQDPAADGGLESLR